MAKQRPKLLIIAHSYYNKAGVEEHVKTLAAELEDRYQISITFPERGAIWLLEQGREPRAFPAGNIPLTAPYRAPAAEQSLAQILQITAPDLIHIVHFVNWHLGVIDQVANAGPPFVMSFHDYYAVTPHYTMQGHSDPVTTTNAEYALKIFKSDISQYLTKRRQVLIQSLSAARQLIVPSPYLARLLERVFPYQFKVIEYGINPFTVPEHSKNWSGLRFGYVGSLLPQKGWDVLLQAFAAVHARHPEASLHYFGGQAPLPPGFKEVYFYGAYHQHQIPEILTQFDVGVIPSVFAETYSLVLSEMWQGGILAAVSDIGAMGERVEDGKNGKKFPPGDVSGTAAVLSWFLEHDDWRSWRVPQPRLANQMADEYDQVYQEALAQKTP